MRAIHSFFRIFLLPSSLVRQRTQVGRGGKEKDNNASIQAFVVGSFLFILVSLSLSHTHTALLAILQRKGRESPSDKLSGVENSFFSRRRLRREGENDLSASEFAQITWEWSERRERPQQHLFLENNESFPRERERG